MKTYSPVFARALKRDVRQALRAEPELRKEHRRVRKYNRRSFGTRWPFRIWIPLVLAGMTGSVVNQPGQHLEAGLLITSWAALLWGLFLAQGWLGIPHRSHDAVALWQLPISDADIFVRERDKLVRSSLFALLDMAACLGAIGLVRHFSAGEWAVVILAAILTWAFLLAASALAAARVPALPLGVAGVWLFNMVVGVILFVVFFGKVSILPYLDRVAPTANLLIPTSWPLGLLGLTDSHPAWSRALLLLPVITVLLSWRDSLRVLAGRCVYREPAIPHAPEIVPGEDDAATTATPAGAPRRIGITAIAEGITSGEFLAMEEWKSGWIERALWNWFTPREKNLAEFAFPRPLFLTRAWYQIARNFLIMVLLVLISTHLPAMIEGVVLVVGMLVVCVHALMIVCTTGATFRPVYNGGIGIPLYTPFPVGMSELSRLFLKCSLIQWPCVFVLALAIVEPAMYFVGQPLGQGFCIALRASVILLAVRIGLLGLVFITGMTDSRRFRPRTWLTLLISAVVVIGFLFLAGAGLQTPMEGLAWIWCVLALGLACLYYAFCHWFYHYLRLDLMCLPR